MGSLCSKQDGHKKRGSTTSHGDTVPEGVLFSVGNPLLDILVTVSPEFLKKHDLQEGQVLIVPKDRLDFYNDIINDLVQNYRSEIAYVAGGSAQNTMRIAQWILETRNACVFVGSIGKDYFGKTLFQKALDDGVVGQYQLLSDVPTGTCLVMLTAAGKRTRLACPAAAELLDVSFLKQSENSSWMEKAQFYFITGYSLVSSSAVAMHVAKYAVNKRRHVILNLSAPYIFSQSLKEVNAILPHVDVVIGGRAEALAFGSSQGFKTDDLGEIALKVCGLPLLNDSFVRMVIFTQGSDPIIFAEAKTLRKYKVPPLKDNLIKDFSGAGDAFTGGFLAQFVQEGSPEICIQCGIWAAAEVIKQEGCQFPKKKTFRPFLLTVVR